MYAQWQDYNFGVSNLKTITELSKTSEVFIFGEKGFAAKSNLNNLRNWQQVDIGSKHDIKFSVAADWGIYAFSHRYGYFSADGVKWIEISNPENTTFLRSDDTISVGILVRGSSMYLFTRYAVLRLSQDFEWSLHRQMYYCSPAHCFVVGQFTYAFMQDGELRGLYHETDGPYGGVNIIGDSFSLNLQTDESRGFCLYNNENEEYIFGGSLIHVPRPILLRHKNGITERVVYVNDQTGQFHALILDKKRNEYWSVGVEADDWKFQDKYIGGRGIILQGLDYANRTIHKSILKSILHTSNDYLIAVGDTGYIVINELSDISDVSDPKQITYSLSQNFPNPFNASTIIKFSLTTESQVSLFVFNSLGEKIATLVNGEELPAGNHEAKFNAEKLCSGVYYYTMQTGFFRETKKMILLK
ncbi:T9SS type A sorting domain-containing protein [Candidatus Falkowbacteria bacterium]|nr:T9SS type A sorting domain-containing protein [Candidatus Falkowbacteria bacterium]